MNTVTIIGLVLLVIGLILIGAEMVIPGFGLPGISGGICLVLGIFMASDSLEQGLTLTVILAVIIAVMLTCVVVFFHSKKIQPPIMLQEEMKAENPFLNAEDLVYLIGKEGTASTDLRPEGKCDIDGVSFEVRSEGEYIKKGSGVRIIRIQGSTLIVHSGEEKAM